MRASASTESGPTPPDGVPAGGAALRCGQADCDPILIVSSNSRTKRSRGASTGRTSTHTAGGAPPLIAHPPPFVVVCMGGAGNPGRGSPFPAAGLAQRPAEIDPIEAEDDVGFGGRLRRVGRDE